MTRATHESRETGAKAAVAVPLVDVPPELLRAALEPPEPIPTAGTVRREIKFALPEALQSVVESRLRLHPAALRTAHPARWVNNVYFDTPGLGSFQDNLAGITRRAKLRLRWYGDDHRMVHGQIELKCKQNDHGWKRVQPLCAPKNLQTLTWREMLSVLSSELNWPLAAQLQRHCRPVVVNRYYRQYHVSADGNVRVTLDSGGTCYDQRLSSRPNLDRPVPGGPPLIIVEVKCDAEKPHQLEQFLQGIPFRLGKHSKYQSAVARLLGLDD